MVVEESMSTHIQGIKGVKGINTFIWKKNCGN